MANAPTVRVSSFQTGKAGETTTTTTDATPFGLLLAITKEIVSSATQVNYGERPTVAIRTSD